LQVAAVPGTCLLAAAVAAAGLAALPALYLWGLWARGLGQAWRRMRLLLASSLGVLVAFSLLAGGWDAGTAVAAVVLVAAAQAVMVQFFERRVVSEAVYGLGGRSVRAGILASRQPTAFATAVGRRVYVTTALYSLASPEEAAAIVAHELGHGEALRPLPPLLVLAVLALAAAGTADAAVELASLCPASALLVAASGLAAWVFYNWAWEHLADLYSARLTGHLAAEALARITGARPAPPPRNPLRLLAVVYASARPRRGPQRFFLVNPHPPPGLRLWLIERSLGAGAPGEWRAAKPQ